MLDNKDWQVELRKTTECSSCQFPQFKDIEISGSRDQVTITLTKKGLYGNMQADPAAFEGWALALLCHCGVKNIVIAVKEGLEKPAAGKSEEQHFERFLYRLANFVELFSPQVTVDRRLAGVARALDKGRNLLLNQPSAHRGELASERVERLAALVGPSARRSEAALEKALEVSAEFRKTLRLDKVMRQWPVGLFEGSVTAKNRVFTGGKSAIDLIGIRESELVLVELKKDGNTKVGAISELLFYSSLMRDTLKKRFGFEELPLRRNCAVSRMNIMGCTSISAVLMAPAMHPLISHPAILTQLNSALVNRWTDFPVHVEVVLIKSIPVNQDEDFIFS
jgi:hypothetical protein